MTRNTEMHFSEIPQISLKRSKFDLSHSHKTTANVGDIVPIYCDEILPGDSVQMDLASLVRMATPIYPVADNLYADYYFFFTPTRLVWEHWQQFWGENDDPWIQPVEYQIPQITAPTGGFIEGTIADYMGIPTKVGNISVNALPFRCYAKIYNDWFRDENLQKSVAVDIDDATHNGSNQEPNQSLYVFTRGGKCGKAAKMHDYFTSCLPSPQKGPDVSIPLGTVSPVIVGDTHTANPNDVNLKWETLRQHLEVKGTAGAYSNLSVNQDGNTAAHPDYDSTAVSTETLTRPSNLYADLSQATAATINQLRTAFAVQKYYENATNGTRYIEYLKNVFGVTSSDARLQRSEYLGGVRVPINMDQIIQTSSTDNTSPQGNTAGFSCTISRNSLFTKSFEEHGYLIGLMVIRTQHTYQQGLNKLWLRKKWVDFYNPYFATLGNMGVTNDQIYAQGTSQDKEVFGYQEAWAEYRYKENRVSGYMRSNATGSLDVWHYADDYSQLPTLGSAWIKEPKENVDRTLAVSSEITHQFICDFYFKTFYTRAMPVYSIPGLIDHV